MKKLLLVLQCHTGDKKMAMELSRLIADMEPKKSEAADFMFAFRWDTASDLPAFHYVQKKFEKTYVFHSTRRAIGWPAGCNELFFDSLRMAQSHADLYDAALFFEADAVPLSPGWIERLRDAWYAGGKPILGHLITKSEFRHPHVNGNCIVSTSITRQIRSFYGSPGAHPWDIFHAKAMVPLSYDPGLIHSNHRKQSITEAELFAPVTRPLDHPMPGSYQPVLYHGVKSMDAQRIVREKFLSHATHS